MSRFTGPLAVTFLEAGSGLAHLDQPLVWELGGEGSGRTVEIPRGFVSDGVSAPRALWSLFAPWGSPAARPAILHDYALSRLEAGDPLPGLTTRAAIDAAFHEALLACGVSRALADLLWRAVRLWSSTARLRQILKGA